MRIHFSDFGSSFCRVSSGMCTYAIALKIRTCDKSDFFPNNFSCGVMSCTPKVVHLFMRYTAVFAASAQMILAGSFRSSWPVQLLLYGDFYAQLRRFAKAYVSTRILVGFLLFGDTPQTHPKSNLCLRVIEGSVRVGP